MESIEAIDAEIARLELEHNYWEGYQASSKIAINSFYGYLGAGYFHYNDPNAAEMVTTTGQKILAKIAALLTATGSRLIEEDTDGIFFLPPPYVEKEEEPGYVAAISEGLPEGINLEHDGHYPVGVFLRIKNYLLIDAKGKRTYKGACLRSRGDEKFGKAFLNEALEALISGNVEDVGRVYAEWGERLINGELGIDLLQRRARVTEKTKSSPQTKRLAACVPDLKVGDTLWVYEREDGALGKVEDYRDDANRIYYAIKLNKFAKRLEPALGDDFVRLCPKLSKKRVKSVQAGQLSLMDF